MPFSQLGLNDQLVQGMLATGYTAPTDIQSRAIPPALQGKDLIGCAQTGTGKTAAFALPLLHLLSGNHSSGPRNVRGLILTPTRELARQVEEFIAGYGKFTTLQSFSVYGGVNMENQVKRLSRGVDIVIATPGRLLDHIQRRTIDLSHVEILVLDEADRMFDMGFINDVRKIVARVPRERQTLLFSATMSKEVRALTASIQRQPEMIEIGHRTKPVDTVAQYFYSVPRNQKLDLLLHILGSSRMDSLLIFSRTKHGADKIVRRLERTGVKAAVIHSNRSQSQRNRALAGFKQGDYKVLVATDIAARGIDVEGISHVINYDTPTFAEDYIHRIGRTGRANQKGDALTFVSHEETDHLRKIERFIDKKIALGSYPGFHYTAKTESVAPVHHAQRSDFKHTHAKARPVEERASQGKRRHGGPQQRQHAHGRKSWEQRREKGEEHIAKKKTANPAEAGETDWRSLLAARPEGKRSFGKKLRQFFGRG
ncbi:MAG TPA: DEAD/DEAH box helicase [Bacteroidota bacterium]|nr:DEAD/DEAH box helicase [Bacteroidota bacterium]